jgi:hypothetical protein
VKWILQSAHKAKIPAGGKIWHLWAPSGLPLIGGFLGLGLLTNEADLQLFAVNSLELTATIGKSCGRKQKKELVQGQPLNRGLDLKLRPNI